MPLPPLHNFICMLSCKCWIKWLKECELIGCFKCKQVHPQNTCWKQGKNGVARYFKKFDRNTVAIRHHPWCCSTRFLLKTRHFWFWNENWRCQKSINFSLLMSELLNPRLPHCWLKHCNCNDLTVTASLRVCLFFPWLRLYQDLATCAQKEAFNRADRHTTTQKS